MTARTLWPPPPVRRTRAERDGPAVAQMIGDLRELIGALDRRLPQLERTGEIDIARDAALLRRKALDRIRELEG